MKNLKKEEKDLILDFYFRCGDDESIDRSRDLIANNPAAAELYDRLESTLTQLDHIKYEPCPDNLAELTVARLKKAAMESKADLDRLIAAEQTRTIRPVFWRRAAELTAVAAVILLAVLVSMPPMRSMRRNYWKQQCQAQLGGVFKGISSYIGDNGETPSVAAKAGSPWWKIGNEGDENVSNTRNLWLLVKGNYVNPEDFVCPAKREGGVLQFDPIQAKSYNDFPARRYITYSFRIKCADPQAAAKLSRRVMIADVNPLFEKLPRNHAQPLKIRVDDQLLRMNSSNHTGRGQSILFSDGSVDFITVRTVGIGADDIYTLQNIKIYEGNEIPSSATDAFLAP
ncbi:MAG: hypothetical protein PHF37_01575 [Phycisphaerae bacterium]|nr:hypothetical protein [Phycisphaerae bacterium]